MGQHMDVNQNRRKFFHASVAAASLAPTLGSAADASPAAVSSGAHETGRKGQAQQQTKTLAAFASGLQFEQIPKEVVQRAKDTLCDTLAVAMFGSSLPWSRTMTEFAKESGKAGRAQVLGVKGLQLEPNAASLANGAFTHAFELDNLTKPNSGSHPGATVYVPLIALAQTHQSTGRELITSFIAGTELMIRIGRAAQHSQEEHGFHAPGTTGPFGSAAACSRLLGLNAEQTSNALGLAASCASGILEFAKSGTGAMVKRMHMGRAAQAGVMAASLAQKGYTGPNTALEGHFGFMNVFCPSHDLNQLTLNLKTDWLTMTTMHKRYACHITAHTPVESAVSLKEEYKFSAEDIDELTIECNERSMRANNIPSPKDILLAQYSVPFCVALSMFRNPVDPRSFDDAAVKNEKIMSLSARIVMKTIAAPDHKSDMTSIVSIKLKNGQEISKRSTAFLGTPERPLDAKALRDKFLMLTVDTSLSRTQQQITQETQRMNGWFDRIQNIENEKNLSWIKS